MALALGASLRGLVRFVRNAHSCPRAKFVMLSPGCETVLRAKLAREAGAKGPAVPRNAGLRHARPPVWPPLPLGTVEDGRSFAKRRIARPIYAEQRAPAQPGDVYWQARRGVCR